MFFSYITAPNLKGRPRKKAKGRRWRARQQTQANGASLTSAAEVSESSPLTNEDEKPNAAEILVVGKVSLNVYMPSLNCLQLNVCNISLKKRIMKKFTKNYISIVNKYTFFSLGVSES